jgi:hypothetical protein
MLVEESQELLIVEEEVVLDVLVLVVQVEPEL